MKTWYMPQNIIDSLNNLGNTSTYSIDNGILSGFRGNIKKIQFSFNDNESFGDQAFLAGDSFIEMLNGTKYYFPSSGGTDSALYLDYRNIPYENMYIDSQTNNLIIPVRGDINWTFYQYAGLNTQASSNGIMTSGEAGILIQHNYYADPTPSDSGILYFFLYANDSESAQVEVVVPFTSINGLPALVLVSNDPTVSGGGGGGASSDQNLTSSVSLTDGKVVGLVSVDPRTTAVTSGGQPLPVGSVLKNASGQKFYKNGSGVNDFVAIETTPPAEWGWSPEAEDAWLVLQGF